MKTKLFALRTALLLAIGTVATTVYAGAGHEGGHDHSSGGGMGHMGHMNDVLQRLKSDLGDKYNQPVPAATEAQLASGKKTYAKLCVSCHGASGKGDGAAAAGLKQKPADFTDAEHSKFYSDQGRMHIIKKGVAGTPMPAWQGILNDEEIVAVHAYVRSLRSTAKKEKHGHSEHAH